MILDAQLTEALLFLERQEAFLQTIASFVNEEDGDAPYLHLIQVLETKIQVVLL